MPMVIPRSGATRNPPETQAVLRGACPERETSFEAQGILRFAQDDSLSEGLRMTPDKELT